MRTAEEMFMAIQEEECPNVNNFTLPEDYQIKAMIAYTEQFIDLAAEKAQEMIYDRQDQQLMESGQGLLLRVFQVCYATPKQSILKLKELLK
jgi:hypothetical protein